MRASMLCLSFIALAACSAPPNPGLRPQHPARPTTAGGIDWAEITFGGSGNVTLYAQRWRPTTGEAKAVVVIHHGLADHSSRYAAFAERLVRAGYAVWAFDMRGHGRSAGSRVVADRIDDLLDDLDAFVRRVRADEPGRPIFVYGHSLGGLVSCLYAIERQPDLAGVVLVAPGLSFDAPLLQLGAIRVLAAIAPNLPALATPHRDFSRRSEVVAEMDGDPLIYQPSGPVRTARAATDGVARVWAAPERLRAPLLVVHGTADHLTAPAGSRDLVARAGASDKTLRLYPGLVHDPLREPDGGGERVASEMVAWLDAHTGGPPVTFTSSVPAGPLAGDHRGRAIALELDARGELPRDRDRGEAGATAGLRVRVGIGRATPLGLGYLGGIDLRGGVQGGGHYEADAHLLGAALRTADGALLAVTGGVGIGGIRGASATHVPIELGAELPAGPLRLFARAGLGWRLSGDHYPGDAHGLADEATALLGARLGRDRRYWGEVTGGGGPFLAITYRNFGGTQLFGVALGLDLFGAD